ncbi:hypothetical protein NIES2104_59180 [Leptolyngbya sp. NIES-2104]|nr:hypothetical protein NIES2104_59180 [Leptolyngbya sp. NIES-2104]
MKLSCSSDDVFEKSTALADVITVGELTLTVLPDWQICLAIF